MFDLVSSISDKTTSEFPIIQSVIDGKQQGDIISDARTHLVCHKSGFGQLLGETELSKTECIDLVSNPRLPQYFHLYAPSQRIIDWISNDASFNTKLRARTQLEYQGSKLKLAVVPTFEIQEIGIDHIHLLGKNGLPDTSTFWSGDDDFLKNSLSVIALTENKEIAAICYSAANALNKAEVDIYTAESYRGSGLGKLVTSKFINLCLENSITPNWDCFNDNLGSLKIAESLGFTKTLGYSFLSIYNKNKC